MKQNKTKFTPGPWSVEGLVESNSVNAFRVVSPCNTKAVADVYKHNNSSDAALIAAAPEMFAALEALFEAGVCGRESTVPTKTQKMLCDVLNKIEGAK